jgi:hypothetical protein
MTEDTGQQGSARATLYDSMAPKLVNAGIYTPAAEFVREVREMAGFRASPRQISTALERLSESGEEISLEAVAGLVAASQGDRSQRQRRHAPEWQALGAALTIQGVDGTPEAQRQFIGVARQVAGPHATDPLLLQISLTLAAENIKLDPHSVGLVGKRIAKSAADLTEEQISEHALREFRNLNRSRTPREKRRSSVAARRKKLGPAEYENKPGKRRWKPGGRRRRTINFPVRSDEDNR